MSKEFSHLFTPILVGLCFAERPGGEKVYVEYFKIVYLELPVVRNYRSKLKQHIFLLFDIFFALFQK